MKKVLIVGISGIALLSGSQAMAADLYTPVPEVTPVSWTGFYVGGQVGGVFDLPNAKDGCRNIHNLLPFDPISPFIGTHAPVEYVDGQYYQVSNGESESFSSGPQWNHDNVDCDSYQDGDTSAFMYGGRVGADVQIGQFVLGTVLDFNGVSGNKRASGFQFDADQGFDTSTDTGPYNLLYEGQYSPTSYQGAGGASIDGLTLNERGTPFQRYMMETELQWYGTGRVRAGMAFGPEGRWLMSILGGVAFGEVKTSFSQEAHYTPEESDRVFSNGVDNTGASSGNNRTATEYNPGDSAIHEEGTSTFPNGGGCEQVAYEVPDSNTGVSCSRSGSRTDQRVGWTIGGSAEYLMNNNMSLGVEANYVNLGDGSSMFADVVPFDEDDLDFWTVMGTLTFRFN